MRAIEALRRRGVDQNVTNSTLARLLWFVLVPLLVGIIVGIAIAPWARASCDPGQYYDPTHQICQGSPPAYPRPGFGNPPSNNPFPGGPR